jgi:transcriptional regulator with XRE-family HTH domain
LLVIMQAIYPASGNQPYTAFMPGGRPPKSTRRSTFGLRLVMIRQQLGLSQSQVATKVGVSQQAYAGWERNTTALRPEDLTKLASALRVSTDDLLGLTPEPKRIGGPVGKARLIFEEVNRLPRHQQQRIIGVVQDLLSAYRSGAEAKAA